MGVVTQGPPQDGFSKGLPALNLIVPCFVCRSRFYNQRNLTHFSRRVLLLNGKSLRSKRDRSGVWERRSFDEYLLTKTFI